MGEAIYKVAGNLPQNKFTTDPDGENEKGLLSCPTADGVEATAVSILAAPGPEIMKKK